MLTEYRNKFNFFDLEVVVFNDSVENKRKLDKDFSYFKSDLESDETFLKIIVYKKNPPFEKVPDRKPTFNRKYSITYDEGPIRFNKYGNKALTIIDYSKEVVEVYSLDEDLLHELSYLIILSRVGKKMDLMGVHRIHGMAFRLGEVDAVFMMEMGGGKSTLLSHLLNYDDIELLSDDTPLIDKSGKILPFPLRLGAYPDIIKNIKKAEENIYLLKRQEYGTKVLISIDGITNKVASKKDALKQIFFQGKRVDGSSSRIIKANIIQKFYYLGYNMVIGFGLPMIFEYFWEKGINDFFVKVKIAFYRFISMCRIISRNDFYIYETGNNPKLNAEILYDFLKEK
ncbi:hypothetical protein [Halobacteriovorax sp.]|uniref:hypothetical protein n=1 Tax=Halobacteriovorax sp. TaxID=2020862 RepID=UPI0035618997